MSEAIACCAVCGAEMDRFFADYPNSVCRQCEKRTLNGANKAANFNSNFDDGDNPVFIDGMKCWRRYRFGGFVTMRDLHDCATLEEFYRKHYSPSDQLPAARIDRLQRSPNM
jgi:hypothetical protein